MMSRHDRHLSLSGSKQMFQAKPARPGNKPHGRRLRFESMEERALLSISASMLPVLPHQYNLENLAGYLSEPSSQAPIDIAKQYMASHASQLGLTTADVANSAVTDCYQDSDSGITHIYLRQQYNDLEVSDANFVVNVMADGRVINAAGGFVSGLSSTTKMMGATLAVSPTLSASQALASLADPLGLPSSTVSTLAMGPRAMVSADQAAVLAANSYSLDPIPARLHYVPTAEGGVALAWDYILRTPDGEHWYDVSADAASGQLVKASDWVDHASYDVFARPVESPSDGSRSVVTDPQDPAASPYGWHDTNGVAGAEYTDTRGNNVFAQEDTDANNSGGFRPDGGASLNFDYTLDLAQAPSTYQSAAITNLFYWNNLCHDIHYKYGFTEAAGNFQVINYSGQGVGNDPVQADAQDGSGTNNANFYTPPDGTSPRMQMFRFNYTSPGRDGDIDNLIITHEFGHGVSNRLVGGPSNVDALDATQSGGVGEGLGDWWGLMFTQKSTDTKTARYPVGTYVLGQTPTGAGIRRYPYSFDMSVNPLTYGNIRSNPEVHDEGEVWCSVLWDMNWLLIDKHGFDPNVSVGYSPGCAGNILALKLVEDSLKLMPANPTFLQSRDAILLADMNLTGGLNQGAIWTAFARRGMGPSAYDGGSANSTSVTEAFDLPSLPRGSVQFSARMYEVGASATIMLTDSDLSSNPSCTVTIVSSAGDSETVSLAAQGAGMFQGSIATSAGAVAPGDHTLEVVAGGTITVTYNDANDGTGHPATVTDQATMFRVDHYGFSTISGSKTAGVGFSVTMSAYDASNTVISGYNGTATLTAAGQGGALSVAPSSVVFASGVWTGDVTVNAVDPLVTLHVANASGATGTSGTFATQAGPLASFQWNTVAGAKYQNIAFPVTLTGKDANGYTTTSFNGTANLSGRVGGSTGKTEILSFIAYADTSATGEYQHTLQAISTYYTAYHETSTTVTDPTALAAALVGKNVFLVPEQENVGTGVMGSLGTSWATVLNNFVSNGGTVIICSYVTDEHLLLQNSGLMAISSYSTSSSLNLTKSGDTVLNAGVAVPFSGSYIHEYTTTTNGTVSLQAVNGSYPALLSRNVGAGHVVMIGTDYYTLGTGMDRVVANAVQWAAPLGVAVSISPSTTGTFVNGVWTGNVTVTQVVAGMHLHADDGSGHGGDSNAFDVLGGIPLTVTLPANAAEGDGVVTGLISVPTAPAVDLVVNFTSTDTARLTVPASVTIAAGSTSAALPVKIIDDALLNGPEAIVISATTTAPNYAPGSASVTVHDDEATVLTVSLPATAHEKDGSLAGTITSDQAPTRDITVQLTSSDSSRLTVPTTVTLLAGQTSATFTATLLDDHVIESGAMPVVVTAETENWSSGTGMVSLLDDDRTMTLTLPSSAWEGQTLAGAGTITIGGTLPTDLVVTLLSADAAELTVPATVTIPHGKTSATFDVTLHSNGQRQGPQTVQVTATATELPTANASMVVKDADVDHFGFNTIGATKTAGVAFSVTARAYDALNNPILVYGGTVPLAASGTSGSLPITPSSVTFASGVWTGNVAVNAVDAATTLHLDNGVGIAGTSNTFAMQPGPLASFQWSTVVSPEYKNVPFSATLTAKDANGFTATDFNGTVGITGQTGRGTVTIGTGTSTWSCPLRTSYHDCRTQVIYLASDIGGPGVISSLALNVASVPGQVMNNWTIRIKPTTLSSYSTYAWEGSDWTTVYQANQTISATGWTTFAFSTPFVYDGTSNLMVDFSINNSSSTSSGSVTYTAATQTRSLYYYTNSGYGDPLTWSGTSPTPYTSTCVPNMRLAIGAVVPVTPTTATFQNGVWAGNVTALETASGMYLRVDDGSGHVANSGNFDVLALPPVTPTVPADLTEGEGTVNELLNIPMALGGDLVVTVTSSDPSRVTVPTTVTIPAGQTSATLPITIIDDALLNGPETVTISTTAIGFAPGSSKINVHDNETAVLTVAIPATALEGAGVLHDAGTITASAAPSCDIVIRLTSTNTTEVAVPATVTLPAGQTTVHFDMTIGDDWLVDGTQTAVVNARVDNWTDGSATIDVYNTDVMSLNGDWSTLGNGPSHTSYFPGILGDAPLTSLLWSVSIAANQVAVADGRVYVTPDSSGLVALNETTGVQLWKYTFAAANSINPPTFDSGHVYVQREDHSSVGGNQLFSIDATTGVMTWSAPFDAQWESYFAPTVADGKIFVDGGYYGGMYGFDQATGAQLFFSGQAQYDEWTPTYYNGKAYSWVAGSFQEHNPTTGAVNWSVTLPWNWNGWSMNTVSAVDNNRAFVIGTAGLYAIDLTTHAQLWGLADTGFSGSPAVQGTTVYAIHGTQVRAYDVATGALKGTYDSGQGLTGQPILTNDGLIVASASKTFLLRRSDLQLLNSIAVGGKISLANNTLYVAASSGTLYAYHLWSLHSVAVGAPASVTEGDGTQTVTVSIPSPYVSDLTVSLTSGDPSRISVPATVVIPAGQVAATVPLTIVDDSLLNGPEAVPISAALAGYNSGVTTITIHDNEAAALTVSLPASALETAGVLTGAGTITSSQAPDADITVQLSSSDTTGLKVPATVVLHAGQTTASFDVTLVDDHVIQGDRPITVSAQMDNWTGGSATLSDLEDDKRLSVTLPASGWEGQTLSAAGTVQLAGTLTTPLTVSLASSDSTELSVPDTVTIPAGQRSATFTVTLLKNGLHTGPLSEQVTATASDMASGTSTMIVKDSDVDHYTFTTISSPKVTATAFSVTAQACDYLNNVITVYSGSAGLSGSGSGGALSISPTSVTFASGVWTGKVTVNAVDPAVTLQVNNGAGAVGTSNEFAVKSRVQIATTSPAPNAVFTLPGPFTYDVTFSEPVTPSSVSTSDLVLSGITGAKVTGVTVLTGNTTARFTLNLPAEGTLVASIAAGAVTDQYGFPNAAFSASYLADVVTVAFPVPLTSVAPVGSLVYSGTTPGVIGQSADTDSFTINLDAGQTLAALVHPASPLQASIQVLDPSGSPIMTATSSAGGADALAQLAAVSTAGKYTIVVGSVGSTTGAYTVSVYVNAALESESHNGLTNDTIAMAQDMTGSFISLGTSAFWVQRGAVVGQTDAGSTPDYYAFTVAANEIDSLGLTGLATGTLNLDLYSASGTLLATGIAGPTNLTKVIGNFKIANPGVYYARVTGGSNVPYSLVVTHNVALDAEANDTSATAQNVDGALGVLGAISGTGSGPVTLSAVDSGWWDITGSHTASNKNYIAGLSGNEHNDYFVFDLTSVTQVIGDAHLNILNPSYASTDPTETYTMFDVSTSIANLEASGSGQTAIFADLGSGTSLAAQTVSSADNGKIVTVPVNSAGLIYLNSARGGQVALGGAITTIVGTSKQCIFSGSSTGTRQLVFTPLETGDWYSLTVSTAGSPIILATSTPADGPGEFVNNLAPVLELYDSSGVKVADGVVGPDGRNQAINYVATAAGVYYIRVQAASGTRGEYYLSVRNPLSLTVPTNATEGDNTIAATISIPSPLASDLIVNMSSADPMRVLAPASVTIPAGQTSASLSLTIIDDTLLNGPEAVPITATAAGFNNAIGTIAIHDNETATLTVNLPATEMERDGTVTGSIASSAAPTRDITVQLVSSDTSRIIVPATVTLPAGQTSVNFTATLLDEHLVESGPTPVTVTAQTENWTSGSATVSLLDNDGTMTLALPTSGWEGQTLAAAGTIMIGGTLPTDLVVTLVSADTAELTVPKTVTIPQGKTSATFDVVLHRNGLRQGTQTVQVTGIAAGLPTANTSMVVRDGDVDHYKFDAISGSKTAGVAFSVTARAYDILDNFITVYGGTPSLTASGSVGSLPITPASVSFASGVWTGNVAVNALDPTVTLHLDDGTGAMGLSNTFATVSGPLASFQWSTIASPQYQNVPFSATLTAKDANGYTVTGFNGSASLGGLVGAGTTAMLLGEPTPDWSGNKGTFTLGYSFTPSSTIYVTDFLHYFGSKISIWTDTGKLVASQSYTTSGAGWEDTPLSTPVQLTRGTTYRIGCYSAGLTYYRWTSTSHVSALGTLGQEYEVSGDDFPTGSYGYPWWAVDLKAAVTAVPPVRVSPTTATFANGLWTGSVAVTQAAIGMHLQVVDGSGHSADSGTFNVRDETAPTATVTLNKHLPQSNDVLTATATKSDADGDPISLTFVWKVNGAVRRTFASATALIDTFDLGISGNGDEGDVVTVAVTPSDGIVTGTAVNDSATISAIVVGREVFYNNSKWDAHTGFPSGDPAANQYDDNAIAADKTALLPNHTANWASYTAYSRGINGIMVDIAGLGGRTLTANDFEFRFGNTADPTAWSLVSAPATVAAPRDIAGQPGTKRIEITWADGVLKNGWLQVTVKANANTGLVNPDVFYFGNAVGETDNDSAKAEVNSADVGRIRQSSGTSNAAITDVFDINRDGNINSADVGLCQQNSGFKLYWLAAPAQLLAAGGAVASPAPSASLSATQLQAIVDAAVTRWALVGVPAAIISEVKNVQFAVAELPGAELGMAFPNRVMIDSDAAGHGWFIDQTPLLDEEFRYDSAASQRSIDPAALDRIDLLTVVMHELGHVAGLDDISSSANRLMDAKLVAGTRLTPTALEVEGVFRSLSD
ncbi:MAG: M36 family metallopeptidase [Planctomycetaceae bacterium]|nr:M36 family metallopeptidase [Planctomycetaceae bacterium]